PIVFAPIFCGQETGYFFKDRSEGLGIRIPHFVHHFVYILHSCFKFFLCCFYFYSLNVFGRSVTSGLLKSSLKVTFTNSESICQFFDRYFFSYVGLNKFLRSFYRFVFVALLTIEHYERRLTLPINFNGEEFCSADRHLAIGIFFNQVEQEIPIGSSTTTGIQSVVFS